MRGKNVLKLNNKQYWKLEMHFSEVFTSSNKVMSKKYGKYPIFKISKISDIFELENIKYITDIYIYYRYISLIYIVPTLHGRQVNE